MREWAELARLSPETRETMQMKIMRTVNPRTGLNNSPLRRQRIRQLLDLFGQLLVLETEK